MRREYIEDIVLVLGGGAAIAGAWIIYWPAGLIVAGLVLITFSILAAKHRASHQGKDHHPKGAAEQAADFISAAAWRFHLPHGKSDRQRDLERH